MTTSPDPAPHLEQAEHNENFFHAVRRKFPDWALTGLFYSALQYIDAFLAKKGQMPHDHKTRAWFVSMTAGLKELDDLCKDCFLVIKRRLGKKGGR